MAHLPPAGPNRRGAAPAVNSYGAIYQAVLGWCTRSPRFPAPWDFVNPPDEAAGPIVDVEGATADLLHRFSADCLGHAGVMIRTPGGGHGLAPELVNPCGALLPLTTHPKAPIFGLLSARGLLPRENFPFVAIRKDRWTDRRLQAGLPLFATPSIRDVLLLRAIGFPAVTTAGLATAHTGTADVLERCFAWSANGAGSGESPRGPLALVGCSLFPPNVAPPPALDHAVARLADLRRHFGFSFAGITAWVPRPAEIDALSSAVQLREPGAARLVLRSSFECLVDFEVLAGRPAPPVPSYPDAFVAVLADLAAGSESVRDSRQSYEAAVHRDLVRPLLDRALADPDPAVRAAGAALAQASAALHLAAPHAIGAMARGQNGREVDKFLTLAAKVAAIADRLARGPGVGW